MTFTADTLLAVRRAPTNRRIGKVRLGDLHHLHWRRQSGGTRSRFMAQPFVFGRILCTHVVEGRIAHSCQHGPPPHEVLVCMCQKDNPKALATLIAHLANLETVVKEAMRQTAAQHWLEVLKVVLANNPVPAKLKRNKHGRGRPHRRRRGKKKASRQAKPSKSLQTASRGPQ
jgi:hypothetical protein